METTANRVHASSVATPAAAPLATATSAPAATAARTLADAHVHLDFMANADEVARDAAARGIALFANTVTPAGFERLARAADTWPNVVAGVGLHPWWVADGRCAGEDVERACDLVRETRWVGEVGLDFSPKHTDPASHDVQVRSLERVAAACAREGDRVLSIHSVRAAGVVLDVLERTGCLGTCTCVFHWFSGSTDEMWRAIRAGCWFSVNEMQARTRRAKEQLKLVPLDRLLLETDLPPGEDVDFSAREVEESLVRALGLVEGIRGDGLGEQTSANWERLVREGR